MQESIVLIGAVMVGIGAVLGRLDSLKEREVVAKQVSMLTERHEPQWLSPSDT